MGFFDQFRSVFAGKKSRLNVRTRFELLGEAIAGTMSKFYRARDRKKNKIVGLKILDKEKTRAFEERFTGFKKPSEGEIAIQLKHADIVETYTHGLTTDDEQYLVMEYIEGPCLDTILAHESQLLDGIRLPLIRQIAAGMGAVHAAGFVHRDIRPRNVMIEPNTGVLKLIDFGLTVPNKPAFLQASHGIGAPNYMAPELINRQPTDQRADIFSFGVTAYEVCASCLPWSRGLDAHAGMDQANKSPTDLRKHRPRVSPLLAEAISWCLEREVARRCPSAEAFLERIIKVKQEDARWDEAAGNEA